jgi:hypothetical protein
MPKFKCTNPKCSKFEKVEHILRLRYVWNPETMRLEAAESFCSECNTFRDPIKEYEGWSDSWFKAESNRNYNNKSVKKYDYDHQFDTAPKVEKIKS